MAFSKFMLTIGGMTLYAKAQQGKTLHFTRIALGDGLLAGGSLVNRSALISERMSLLIDGVQLVNDSTDAAVIATLSNVGLSQGFTAREAGLFAEDPDTHQEVLYLYAHAGTEGEPIPDGNSGSLVYERIKIIVTLDNTGSVTFDASGNPLYLAPDDVAPIVQASLSGATAKTTLTDNDTLPLSDSEDGLKQKKISFSNLKAVLETFFNTKYNNYVHPTTTGNKHIPADGADGQFLKYGGTSGTAAWATPSKSDVGLDNVDNTSDADKPVSAAQQTAILGFFEKTTVFNSDGSITETLADGTVIQTEFPSDDTIIITQTSGSEIIVKTITFNADGSISEVIS